MKKIFIPFLILFISKATFANGLTLIPSVGLGYSDNVYYSDSNEKSDFYNRFQASGKYRFESKSKISFNVTFDDYSSEQQNDVFRFFTNFTNPLSINNWSVWGKIIGQQFVNKAPGNTEQNFNYFGAGSGIEKNVDLGSSAELTFGPGVILKKFSGAADRLDKQFFLASSVFYALDTKNSLSGLIDLGLVKSDDDLFENRYFSMSLLADHTYNRIWSFSADLTFSRTTYFNRDISIPTIVTNRRGGRVKETTSNQNERYNFINFGAGAIAQLTNKDSFSFEVNTSRQTSVSGLQDFTVTELFIEYQRIF